MLMHLQFRIASMPVTPKPILIARIECFGFVGHPPLCLVKACDCNSRYMTYVHDRLVFHRLNPMLPDETAQSSVLFTITAIHKRRFSITLSCKPSSIAMHFSFRRLNLFRFIIDFNYFYNASFCNLPEISVQTAWSAKR